MSFFIDSKGEGTLSDIKITYWSQIVNSVAFLLSISVIVSFLGSNMVFLLVMSIYARVSAINCSILLVNVNNVCILEAPDTFSSCHIH